MVTNLRYLNPLSALLTRQRLLCLSRLKAYRITQPRNVAVDRLPALLVSVRWTTTARQSGLCSTNTIEAGGYPSDGSDYERFLLSRRRLLPCFTAMATGSA